MVNQPLFLKRKKNNLYYPKSKAKQTAKNLSMARVLYMGLPFPAEPQKTAPSSSSSSSPSKPLKLPHRTCSTNISIPSTAKGNNKPC